MNSREVVRAANKQPIHMAGIRDGVLTFTVMSRNLSSSREPSREKRTLHLRPPPRPSVLVIQTDAGKRNLDLLLEILLFVGSVLYRPLFPQNNVEQRRSISSRPVGMVCLYHEVVA